MSKYGILRFRNSNRVVKILCFCTVFGVIAVVLLTVSRAATPTASIELGVGAVIAPAANITDPTASGGSALVFAAQSSSGTGLSVSTKYFTKDGQQFYPKGFNSIGLLQPDNCPRKKSQATTADNNYNVTELNAIKNTFSGNIIRLQISQKGMDPQDSELKSGHAAYMTKVKDAVALARAQGLVVILSMQDQVYSCGFAHPLPSSETVRAWQAVVPEFKDNPYVMFELFNEPVSDETAAGWAQWRNGAATPVANTGSDGSTFNVVGHQTLLTTIRGLGGNNVLIAEGANKAGKFQGIWTSASSNYLLTDTLSPAKIAYAIHPYYFHLSDNSTLASDKANWTSRWGYLRDTTKIAANLQFPIIATEWNASANCAVGQTARTVEFLNELKTLEIGMTAHAIDTTTYLVTAIPGWQPNTFTTGGSECAATSGAGTVLKQFYEQN